VSDVSVLDRFVTSQVRVRGWEHRGGGVSWPVSAHAALEVACVESGAIGYRVGRKDLEVGPGDAIAVPARTEHASRLAPGTRATSVWIGLETICAVGEAMGATLDEYPLVLSGGGRAATLARLLRQEGEAEGPGQILAVEALAEALAVAVLREAGHAERRPLSRDARIQRALDVIERRYSEALTVDDLARQAGLSRFHFSRLFREQVGESPYQRLRAVRLDRAAELLRRGGRTVTEVALSVGFQDLGRFGRAFASRFGVLPRDYPGGTARNARPSARTA
jgi:AraC family transcriptional regulator